MVCADGPLVTGGAALAQTELMLHLLRARFGARLADDVARVLLIDARQAQSPYVVPAMPSNGNELVARLTRRIESTLPESPSVTALAAEFAMSPRTLSRRVHAATGRGALALMQSLPRARCNRRWVTNELALGSPSKPAPARSTHPESLL